MDGLRTPLNGAGTPPGNPFRRMAGTALRLLIAAAALVWVFYDIRPDRLAGELSHIRWEWVAAAVGCDIVSYVCQGLRWKQLLAPLGEVSWFQATRAVYAGLFTNEVLPMRVGEAVRAYLVSRRLSSGIVAVIPSMAVERLFDGVWLAAAFGLTAMFVPLPPDILTAADILGAVVLCAAACFLLVAFLGGEWISRIERGVRGPRMFGKAVTLLARIVSGLRIIGRARSIVPAFAVSSGILIFQTAAFWFVMIAYGIDLPPAAGAAVFLIVHLGTAIPNAPSNIGTYQFFTVLGLSLFGIDKTSAAGFSAAVFVILTVPLWLLGIFALSGTGLSARTIRADAARILGERSDPAAMS